MPCATGKLISIKAWRACVVRPSQRSASCWKSGPFVEAWEGEANPEDAEKLLKVSVSLLEGVGNVDLPWVDGPPVRRAYSVATRRCWYWLTSSSNAEVWMDPSARKRRISVSGTRHGFEPTLPLEKGLGRLTRPDRKTGALHRQCQR